MKYGIQCTVHQQQTVCWQQNPNTHTLSFHLLSFFCSLEEKPQVFFRKTEQTKKCQNIFITQQ